MIRCEKHPKYTGMKTPKTQCLGCLNYYIKLGKMQRKVLPPPTKVHKNKKEYSSKKKHPQKED